MHVTSYDYHTKIGLQTGHNSPLYGIEGKDVNATWNYLLERGAIAEKTVIGIPFYGRTFHLVNCIYLIKNKEAISYDQFQMTDHILCKMNNLCLEDI